ncbi:30S ribosomal protein S1 [bacterium]|nr:30S ribosomal protein S1 [bacterium]
MSKEIIRPEQYARAEVMEQELEFELSEEQLAELSEMYEGIFDTIKQGKLITGQVKRIDSDGVLVDINYKSEGLIPKHEFAYHELKDLKEGSEIEVILDEMENIDGNVILSYEKAKALKAWDAITKLFEAEKPVEGVVTHKVKGGLSVDIGIPAFLPGSQIDIQRITDFDQFVGQTITANVIKLNKKRGNVIISRRKYLSDLRAEARQLVLEKLNIGEIIPGIVKNITNYGVFIDIGGVDGLLHITDMTWGRISHPSELVKIGDKVDVKVLSFDKNNEKISLGLKQLSSNPWDQIADKIKVSSRITGKISSITDYGLFVEVAKGVEGLVHISEISWTDRITNLPQKFKPGQELEVLVVSADPQNRRMSLSIKQLEQNPWQAIGQKFEISQKIKGTISNITDFGIFVQLMPGVDGLVHISDLSWTEHINHPSDIYNRNDEVEAIILGIDENNKKISLGIKQLTPDPWEVVKDDYPVGTIIDGEVSKTTSFGAFIKLPSGIEGLVHISELSDKTVEKVEDVVKVGDKKQFRVINLNKEERKLGLSLNLEGKKTVEKKPAEGKPKAAKQSKPRAKKAVQKQQPSKQKSALQIALEEHAARQDK